MKKIFALFLIFAMLTVGISVNAVSETSYRCTLLAGDISGENYQIYFSNCRGHYSNDTVTVYITNTSKREALFQVTVGFQGGEVQTTAESGYVKLDKGVTGKFVLTDISQYPEKANTTLGYVPGSALSESSVVRVQVKGLKAGDTFLVSGIDGFSRARDTSFQEIEANAIMSIPTDYAYINDARLVIKKETEKKEDTGDFNGYTLTQPDSEAVDGFLKFVVISAVICVGGIIVYTFIFITKRREKND